MADPQDNTLLAPRFLFRFSVPLRRHDAAWKATGIELPESHRLLNLAELDANPADRERPFADVRAAWNVQGLLFNVTVTGRATAVVPRRTARRQRRPASVDRYPRDAQHPPRSRYCHRYAFLPAGGGRSNTDPVADQVLINRARENARPVRPRELQVASKITKTGYWLSAFVPAAGWAVTIRCNIANSALRIRFTTANSECKHSRPASAFRFRKTPRAGRFWNWSTIKRCDRRITSRRARARKHPLPSLRS